MARIFIDGFESGGTDAWDGVGASALVGASYKHTGSYGVELNGGTNDFLSRSIGATQTLYCAMKWKGPNPISNTSIFSVLESGVLHLELNTFFSGSAPTVFFLKRGSTFIADSGSFAVVEDTWCLLEAYIYIHDTNGRFVLKVNGITRIDFTGDTRNGGTNGNIDTFRIGFSQLWLPRGHFDDIVLDDAAWIGDTAVLGLSPTGAGATTQWDPSAGSNYACVDEVPPGDTDYVSTNVNDEIDTYALADLPTTPAIQSVKCVQVMARARKEGASTPQKIALVVRAGGTDYPSGDKTLPTSFGGGLVNLWTQNPNTAAAWTESGVNGIEAGVKARA